MSQKATSRPIRSEDEMVQWFKELMLTIEGVTPLDRAFHLANAMREACGGVWVIQEADDHFTIECSKSALSGASRTNKRIW